MNINLTSWWKGRSGRSMKMIPSGRLLLVATRSSSIAVENLACDLAEDIIVDQSSYTVVLEATSFLSPFVLSSQQHIDFLLSFPLSFYCRSRLCTIVL